MSRILPLCAMSLSVQQIYALICVGCLYLTWTGICCSSWHLSTVHLAKMCQGAWLTSLPTQGRGRQLLADKRRCHAQILSSLPRACALVVGELVRVSVLVAVGLVAWLVRSPNRA